MDIVDVPREVAPAENPDQSPGTVLHRQVPDPRGVHPRGCLVGERFGMNGLQRLGHDSGNRVGINPGLVFSGSSACAIRLHPSFEQSSGAVRDRPGLTAPTWPA
jgi:hypothetical protein